MKGKSAKKGVLSGFVPFVQLLGSIAACRSRKFFRAYKRAPRISENEHKQVIEESPADSRVVVCLSFVR